MDSLIRQKRKGLNPYLAISVTVLFPYHHQRMTEKEEEEKSGLFLITTVFTSICYCMLMSVEISDRDTKLH